jgi:hypothetical protein
MPFCPTLKTNGLAIILADVHVVFFAARRINTISDKALFALEILDSVVVQKRQELSL